MTAVLGAAAGLTACSADVDFSIGGRSPDDAAVELIEGELSEALGIGMTGECDEVDDPDIGTSFECTGTTDDGRVVEFVTLIDADDHILVDSTNVVVADAVPAFEAAAAEAVAAEVGAAVESSAVDCGAESVVLGADATMACTITQAASGDVYDMTLTVTDLDAGAFDIAIADAPR
jgi:hypothetical protein